MKRTTKNKTIDEIIHDDNIMLTARVFYKYQEDFNESPLESVEETPEGLEFMFNDIFLDKLKEELGDKADESLQLFITELLQDFMKNSKEELSKL